ncbi:MAG: bifunctional folylpolyglutamate synthase/dihydrofolate synthase [Fimbriimonadales bacterium]
MSPVTYREALDYIDGLAPRGWRLGLDRMREFAHRAGLDDSLGIDGIVSPTLQHSNTPTPQHSPRFIHVAGTNGKGSTTAYLQSILHETGYRTGAFYSPYVYDPRERIQLGREYIPEGIFAGLTAMLQPVAEEFTETEFGGISEFEFKTAMAFLFFKRLKCEWVALEVGLGGRLDATSIVTPRCSIIVSVGLDHTNILGDTIDQIAHEKAGVIKPGVPVIIGQMPDAARAIMERQAAEYACETWLYGREITIGHALRDGTAVVTTPRGRHAGLGLGIKSAMQTHNMALAVAACDAAEATRTLGGLQRGTAKASIPGRFEIRRVRGKTVILDGAHNSDAAHVLVESLQRNLAAPITDSRSHPLNSSSPRPRILLVTGMVAGHDPSTFYGWFEGVADQAFVVPIDFHRTLQPEQIAAALRKFIPHTYVFDSAREGLRAALSEASEGDVILVTGSFYLVGEAGRSLNTEPLGSGPEIT